MADNSASPFGLIVPYTHCMVAATAAGGSCPPSRLTERRINFEILNNESLIPTFGSQASHKTAHNRKTTATFCPPQRP
eukprot:scaffold13479_cov166-Amphora_coffeaeformis.AAC.3